MAINEGKLSGMDNGKFMESIYKVISILFKFATNVKTLNKIITVIENIIFANG